MDVISVALKERNTGPQQYSNKDVFRGLRTMQCMYIHFFLLLLFHYSYFHVVVLLMLREYASKKENEKRVQIALTVVSLRYMPLALQRLL